MVPYLRDVIHVHVIKHCQLLLSSPVPEQHVALSTSCKEVVIDAEAKQLFVVGPITACVRQPRKQQNGM